jgi:5,10-methylene-tetrahydrofolate dehydrogenase/methenyl tetrahydrofolate cyclohydrolase
MCSYLKCSLAPNILGSVKRFRLRPSSHHTSSLPLSVHCSSNIVCNDNTLNWPIFRFSTQVDPSTSAPEYLVIVTQTVEKMRQSVREYVADHSKGLTLFDGLQNKDSMLRYRESDDKACVSQPKIKLVGIIATTSTHNTCGEDDTVDTHGNERYSEQISAICAADGILYEPWRVPPTRDALERSIRHANERLDVHGILVFYPVSDKLVDNKDDAQKSARGPNKCNTTGVYYKTMDDYFRDLVSPQKDVEGYHRKALRIKNNSECRDNEEDITAACASSQSNTAADGQYGPVYPCTALAVFRILESFQTQSDSIHITNDDTNPTKKKYFTFANATMTIINRSEVVRLLLVIF